MLLVVVPGKEFESTSLSSSLAKSFTIFDKKWLSRVPQTPQQHYGSQSHQLWGAALLGAYLNTTLKKPQPSWRRALQYSRFPHRRAQFRLGHEWLEAALGVREWGHLRSAIDKATLIFSSSPKLPFPTATDPPWIITVHSRCKLCVPAETIFWEEEGPQDHVHVPVSRQATNVASSPVLDAHYEPLQVVTETPKPSQLFLSCSGAEKRASMALWRHNFQRLPVLFHLFRGAIFVYASNCRESHKQLPPNIWIRYRTRHQLSKAAVISSCSVHWGQPPRQLLHPWLLCQVPLQYGLVLGSLPRVSGPSIASFQAIGRTLAVDYRRAQAIYAYLNLPFVKTWHAMQGLHSHGIVCQTIALLRPTNILHWRGTTCNVHTFVVTRPVLVRVRHVWTQGIVANWEHGTSGVPLPARDDK